MGKIYDALKRAEKESEKIINKGPFPDTVGANSGDESSVPQKISKHGNETPTIENANSAAIVSSTTKESDLKLISGNLSAGPLIKEKSTFSLQNILLLKQKNGTELKERYLPTLQDPHSIAAEQYKILRSRIISFCQQHNLRTLLITSTLPGEGKSTVASNLSVVIANSINDHALLIDSDLRKPTIHTSFSLNNSLGLSNYLSGDIPFAQTLHKTPIEKLTVLPAGTGVHNPSELLSSRKMKDLIDEIKKRYDDRYIIFDSTPLQQTPEPVVISKHVDGIIFVVRAGFTNRELVKRSLDSLDKSKIIGVVFNMVQDRVKPNYYNYYYSQQAQ